MPERSWPRPATASPRRAAIAATAPSWPCPSSSTPTPAGASSAGRPRENRAVGVEPVRTAIERAASARVRLTSGISPGNVGARDVGRVGQHQVEPAGQRRRPVGDGEGGPAGEPGAPRILPRQQRRRGGAIDPEPPGARKLGERRQQQAAGAGAEIEHRADAVPVGKGRRAPPRSAPRCRRAAPASPATPADRASRTRHARGSAPAAPAPPAAPAARRSARSEPPVPARPAAPPARSRAPRPSSSRASRRGDSMPARAQSAPRRAAARAPPAPRNEAGTRAFHQP